MIGGGKWESQDKELHGVYINFNGEDKSSSDIDNANADFLTDANGVFLLTADSLYFTVI